jgi:hypothetical protein
VKSINTEDPRKLAGHKALRSVVFCPKAARGAFFSLGNVAFFGRFTRYLSRRFVVGSAKRFCDPHNCGLPNPKKEGPMKVNTNIKANFLSRVQHFFTTNRHGHRGPSRHFLLENGGMPQPWLAN